MYDRSPIGLGDHVALGSTLAVPLAAPTVFCHPPAHAPPPHSAFRDNGRNVSTGLAAALRAANVTSVWVAGLALDYCAGWTAADALLEGFTSTLVLPATAPVARAGGAAAAARLRAAGVRVLERMPSKRQLRS